MRPPACRGPESLRPGGIADWKDSLAKGSGHGADGREVSVFRKNIGFRFQVSVFRCQRSDVRGQRLEVRSQKSEARSQTAKDKR